MKHCGCAFTHPPKETSKTKDRIIVVPAQRSVVPFSSTQAFTTDGHHSSLESRRARVVEQTKKIQVCTVLVSEVNETDKKSKGNDMGTGTLLHLASFLWWMQGARLA